jgi:hypothetical protein
MWPGGCHGNVHRWSAQERQCVAPRGDPCVKDRPLGANSRVGRAYWMGQTSLGGAEPPTATVVVHRGGEVVRRRVTRVKHPLLGTNPVWGWSPNDGDAFVGRDLMGVEKHHDRQIHAMGRTPPP